jgi:hypothetical protein
VTEVHLDDERLSAVVDGLADADDAAHAADCPECRARLHHWQRVVGQLASVPEPTADDSRRDAAIAAALATNTFGIEGARKRRGLGRSPLAGLAAAVLVVAGLAFGLSQAGGGSPKTASSGGAASASANSSSTAAGRVAPLAPSTPTNAPSALAGPTAGGLGTFDTPSSLVAVLRQYATKQTLGVPNSRPASGCRDKTAAYASVSPATSPTFGAALTYRGQPATVSVFATNTGHVAVVESDDGCVLLARVSWVP